MTREEAIEKVRQMSLPKETMEILEALAPELRESEDERIRKEIIKFIQDFCNPCDSDCDKWIAYLEKQKEYVSEKFDDVWASEDCEELIAEGKKLSPRFEELLKDVCHAWYDKGIEVGVKQKEQSIVANDLDEEIHRFFNDCIDVHEAKLYGSLSERVIPVDCYELTARHFAKWGEKQKEKEGMITVSKEAWDENAKDSFERGIKVGMIRQQKESLRDFIDDFPYSDEQKEQKPKIIIPKFRIGEYIKPKPYNEKHLIKDINENGYVLDVDFVVPFKDEDVWEVVEQKPAEWSENFEENIRILLQYKLTQHSEDGSISSTVLIDNKTLKDICAGIWFYVGKEALKYPNKELNVPKWSEEDENALENLHELISFGFIEKFCDAQTTSDMRKWLNTRLKSLRPSWKPSEEQIYSLGTVVKGYNECTVGSVGYHLKEMYEQLKKLI